MRMLWESADGRALSVSQVAVGEDPGGRAWTELHLSKDDLERMLAALDDGREVSLTQWLQAMLVRNVAPEPPPEGTITGPDTKA